MSENSFEIISDNSECIILKSQYHYWRIIKRDDMYFLHHKHDNKDNFHVQKRATFYNLRTVYKYISSYDEYYDGLNHE